MTTDDLRLDPLAFLGEELDDLRKRHLYRPLRVMSSGQGPIVSVDEERLISLVVERLPRADPPSPARRRRSQAIRDYGAGSGAVRTIAGTMTIHEELERELAEFKGTAATLTFQSGLLGQHRRHPDDHRRAGPDRLRRAQPRLDHRRHAALEGAAEDLPATPTPPHLRAILDEAVEKGREGTGLPYRLILVVTDGVFCMDGDIAPLPGIVEAAESAGAAVFVDDAHASGVLGRDGRGHGRPLRAPRPGRDPGRDAEQGGRSRSAVTSPARRTSATSSSSGLGPSSSRPPTRRPSSPPAARRSGSCRTSPSSTSGCGPTRRRFKAELTRLGFDTGRSETPITPVMMGDPDTAGAVQPAPVRGGRLRPAGRLPDGRHRQGPDPDDRDRRPRRRPARPGARGVRDGRPRARPHRRVTAAGGPPPSRRTYPPRPATCRSTRTSTPTSRPTRRPDRRLRRGRPSSAGSPSSRSRTTSTSTRGRRPSPSRPFEERERTAREAAERWAPHGVAIRFGVEITYDRRHEADIRDHLARHAYDYVIGSVHVYADSPFHASRVAAWIAGRSLAEIVAPYFDEVARRDPVRACSTRSATSTS